LNTTPVVKTNHPENPSAQANPHKSKDLTTKKKSENSCDWQNAMDLRL
jgi:hypothetical protein